MSSNSFKMQPSTEISLNAHIKFGILLCSNNENNLLVFRVIFCDFRDAPISTVLIKNVENEMPV